MEKVRESNDDAFDKSAKKRKVADNKQDEIQASTSENQDDNVPIRVSKNAYVEVNFIFNFEEDIATQGEVYDFLEANILSHN